MTRCTCLLRHLLQFACMPLMFLIDISRFLLLCLRSPAALAAENLFLRKQLALYQERKVKPRRATNATRLAMTALSRQFDWLQAPAIVPPQTFIRWHCQGFRLWWRWESRPGRPPLPVELRTLLRTLIRYPPHGLRQPVVGRGADRQ